MNIHPHVRALLHYEEQRLAATIECSSSDEPLASTTSVVLRWPSGATPSSAAAISGRDGAAWRLDLTTLLVGEPICVEASSGPVAVASTEASIVRLGFDPSQLVASGEQSLLSVLWDRAVGPALEKAARYAQESVDTLQVEAFMRLEERWHREVQSRLPSAIENSEYALSRLESQMRELIEKTMDMRRQEHGLRLVGHETLRSNARSQWLALRRLIPNAYRSIELRGDTLAARTHVVTIEHGDSEVDVGEFEITIDVVAGAVRVTNRTNPVQGTQHPHVRDPGSVCWGNLLVGLTRLVAEREWAGVLTVVYRFLHAYNDRDAYLKLEAWDPDHHDSDDDGYDDEGADDDSDDDTVECCICLEQTASDEITHVEDQPTCLACWERDSTTCSGCNVRVLSRNVARESLRCRTCVPVPAQNASQEVAS